MLLTKGYDLGEVQSDWPALFRKKIYVELQEAASLPPAQKKHCDYPDCSNPGYKKPWICCNVCGRWCHFVCVGVEEASIKKENDYECPICVAQYD